MFHISLVIPAFNEEGKVGADLAAGAAFMRAAGLRGEIILVDDGSLDATAAVAASEPLPPEVDRRVISFAANRGKGAAVRAGVAASRGEVILVADSGSCTPLEEARRGMELITSGEADIAIASRRLAETVILRDQSPWRRFGSRLYMGVLHRLVRLQGRFTDTQCGFKLFRGDLGRHLFGQCFTDGFMFDLEVLLRALQEGVKVVEFPIRWCCDADSRLRPHVAAWACLGEAWRIRRRLSGPP